ncbi:hypothetical protein MBLNU457_6709t1 [Dothideomycetes sp. NU457]
MARTRAQERAQEQGDSIEKPTKDSKKVTTKSTPKKRQHVEEDAGDEEPEAKAAKQEDRNASADTNNQDQSDSKIDKLVKTYGAIPLSDTSLEIPELPNAKTLLALLFNAMLTSTRISHQLAYRSVNRLIDEGWADVNKLKESTWERRTEVLTEGGYTHYREKTATMLGELADLVIDKYNGDLNNLAKEAGEDRDMVRARLKDIKGLGNVAVDVFCDTAQGVWPFIAPFLDDRSRKTAEEIGITSDVNELFKKVDQDPMHMCELAAALTHVRLEKKTKEFQ